MAHNYHLSLWLKYAIFVPSFSYYNSKQFATFHTTLKNLSQNNIYEFFSEHEHTSQ